MRLDHYIFFHSFRCQETAILDRGSNVLRQDQFISAHFCLSKEEWGRERKLAVAWYFKLRCCLAIWDDPLRSVSRSAVAWCFKLRCCPATWGDTLRCVSRSAVAWYLKLKFCRATWDDPLWRVSRSAVARPFKLRWSSLHCLKMCSCLALTDDLVFTVSGWTVAWRFKTSFRRAIWDDRLSFETITQQSALWIRR